MKTILLAAMLLVSLAGAQQLTGVVVERSENGTFSPIIGANVVWLGTSSGTVTDTSGVFRLPVSTATDRLVVSYVGYISDTVTIRDQSKVNIILKSDATAVAEVEVVGERQGSFVSYLAPQKTITMTEKELFKAACCNLSESFETNPSIDVSFTDAVTGTKQIEMLGLSGVYSQITVEAIPAIRGLTSTIGLSYIPGTWIESIQISKGTGSVANGYESITGQINTELRKPEHEDEKTLFLNLYGSADGRVEGNLDLRTVLSEDLSSMTMLHGSMLQNSIDRNHDRFLDMPRFGTMNAIQRFHFSHLAGWEGQIGVQYVQDAKRGGTIDGAEMSNDELRLHPQDYRFTMNGDQLRVWGKTGHVFPQKQYQSIGLQWSLTRNRQHALFPTHAYDGNEETAYLNLIYQSVIGTTEHQFRTGLSLLRDAFDETYGLSRYQRTEIVPGLFGEYTYTPGDEFSMIAGLRVDEHNLFGTFVTPRLHLRYTPQEDWVLRLSAGRGTRTANVLMESMPYLASARHLSILPANTKPAYGLSPEVAWNTGFNITHYFLVDYRDASITLDLYRTVFENQIVTDLDSSPQQVILSELNGRSYSNSAQIELNLQPVEHLDTRVAYRFYDVRQTVNGTLRERPFVARHRAFVNFGYATDRADDESAMMLYDLTVQWFGPKRLPDTQGNPAEFRARAESPSFVLVNAQVTRSFYKGLDVYLGIDNLLNFRQTDPILDAANPNGIRFDASLVWGPLTGRNVYAGLRWKI